ncbi:something about silencing protein 10 [Cephus cinctus]|uniref:Something about silencing protein 10 n=1 Tax=Cephus cinctus TaxID=211228 RepID=A0AAJ7C3Q0_CEPCN|nr:something about silencing protein 10 [Cephus cinctus]
MANKKRFRKDILNEDPGDLDDLSNSEDEYTETERYLLEKARKKRVPENFDSEDEVYGLQDENEEDDQDEDLEDSLESDIEGLQDDFELPDERAWGKKKNAYYSTDYVDPDYASASQKDMADAEMEEEEARNIQKRLAEQLDDADFGLDLLQSKEKEVIELQDKDQIVKTDLTKLSKREKQLLVQKESPEFQGLVNDFKERLTEVRDFLAPFLKFVERGKCPACPAISFIKSKYQLILNYCVNISFYLMLKAKRLPVTSHPVIKRLAQYRQLLNQLESGQGKLLEQVKEILSAEKKCLPIYSTIDYKELGNEKKKCATRALGEKLKRARQENKNVDVTMSKKTADDETADEEIDEDMEHSEHSELIDTEINDKDTEDHELAMDESDTEEGKRAITYQIAKNKGLTPHRKKEQRNPRVKHRNKYRKAKIRRKGAVREVRKEVTRYAGEISGIKASVKKSIKLK